MLGGSSQIPGYFCETQGVFNFRVSFMCAHLCLYLLLDNAFCLHIVFQSTPSLFTCIVKRTERSALVEAVEWHNALRELEGVGPGVLVCLGANEHLMINALDTADGKQ